jgi:hypothetical protein
MRITGSWGRNRVRPNHRDDEEVHPEGRRHEPGVPERPSNPDERDLEEGYVEEDREHGIDELFEGRTHTWLTQSHADCEKDSDGIDGDLIVLNPLLRNPCHGERSSKGE